MFKLSSFKKKMQKIIFATALIVMMSLVAPITVKAQTVEELQAQIASLLQQITLLQTQLSSLNENTSTTDCTSYSWLNDLSVGDNSSDVLYLQKVLNTDVDTQVAVSGVGSAGNETSYFGSLSKQAVIKFQNKYASEVLTPVGLTYGTGYVGVSTRTKLNEMYGSCSITNTEENDDQEQNNDDIIVGSDQLYISSNIQPEQTLAPENAARLPFTTITLQAGSKDVTVYNITVELKGLVNKSAFTGIVLIDEDGMVVGNEKQLNSNNQVVFNNSFVIKANTTVIMRVGANMSSDLSSEAGSLPRFEIVDVDASSSIVGKLPIVGTTHTVNSSLNIGEAYVTEGNKTPDNDTETIGSDDLLFRSINIENVSEEGDIVVNSIKFYNAGNISSSDLKNLKVEVRGVDYNVISTDSRYFIVKFGSGIIIPEGDDEDFELRGSISSDSSVSDRRIEFTINRDSDVNISSRNYNYGIVPTVELDSDVYINISEGKIKSFSVNNEVTADTIIRGQNNQVLAGFKIETEGEDINVEEMIFNVNINSSNANYSDITHIKLVDQYDNTLEGPVNVTNNNTISFSNVNLNVGTTKLYLEARISNDFESGDKITISTNQDNWIDVRGDLSNNIINTISGVKTAHVQTISDGGVLTVIKDSLSPKNNIVLDNKEVLLAVYKFSADDEDINLKELTLTASSTADTDDIVISSYTLRNSNSYLSFTSDEDEATTTIKFDDEVVISKDNKVLLYVYGFISNINDSTFVNGDSIQISLTSYKATGAISDKEFNENSNIVSSVFTIFESYPAVSWKLGGSSEFIPQGKLYVDTLSFNSYGDEEITIDTVKLHLIGATSTLDLIVEDENGNELTLTQDGDYVTVNVDKTADQVELKVYANTLSFETGDSFQIVVENDADSIVFSIDGIINTFNEGDNILSSGSIFSRSYSKK